MSNTFEIFGEPIFATHTDFDSVDVSNVFGFPKEMGGHWTIYTKYGIAKITYVYFGSGGYIEISTANRNAYQYIVDIIYEKNKDNET